jgi:hypothetical protein
MEDEEIDLLDTCLDLVCLKKHEAFPLALLSSKAAAEWVSVRTLCQQVGVDAGDLTPSLFATWLSDPAENQGFVVILFYDDDSKGTAAAHFNKQLLVENAKTYQATSPGGATLSIAKQVPVVQPNPEIR